MLFKASITKDVLANEDKLCEQLYIFLNDYVPRRLIYENDFEREDCVQETILYLLKRYKSLPEDDLEHINIEKFFFNRAKSYISSYIRKLSSYHTREKLTLNNKVPKYFPGNRSHDTEYLDFIEDVDHNPENAKYLDDRLLNSIIEEYGLDDSKSKTLKSMSLVSLSKLGYFTYSIEQVEDSVDDPNGVLSTLSLSVVDEYLIQSATEKGEEAY